VTEDVAFGDCRGWLYRPDDAAGPLPIVVLVHGLGATHVLHYWRTAEAFTAAGFAVLDFDPRHLGASGGEPRQVLSLADATADLRAAVAYARSRADVADPERVVLYASSIGCAMAIDVAAEDDGIAALLLVVPSVDARTNFPDRPAEETRWLIAESAERRLVKLFGAPDERAVINRDDVLGILPSELEPGGSWSGATYTSAGGSFRNEIAPWELAAMAATRPADQLATVGCPVSMVVATEDTVTPPGPQRDAARAIDAEVIEVPGGHFAPFIEPQWSVAFTRQLAFLDQHVAART
jgi:alpha-beta hydrolase superfamily lysophospholipase